ncbi:MAG: porin family protein [Bacteroidota bacterium]
MKTNFLQVLFFTFLAVAITDYSHAQQQLRKRSKKKNGYNTRKPLDNPFLKSQWWLGFRAGANLTDAVPDERFSAFSPINYTEDDLQKEYESFNLLGGHAGIEITYYHRGFSFSFQPNYRRQRFEYSNDFIWMGTDGTNTVELRYVQDHQLDYIEFPLFVKYDIVRASQWRPFVQIGAYYGLLTGANKSMEVSGSDTASGAVSPFENESVIIGAEDLFIRSSAGLAGGIGLNYDVQNVRIVFDITYRYGLHNITDTENRFSENQLSGIGDALDDLTLRNISASFGILFPLRYITRNSKSFDAIN